MPWKLRAPVPYRDARRMRNSVLSSVSRLYRDSIAMGIPDSAVFTTKRGSLGIRIPDSSSVSIVSRCDRDTEVILCSGLACLEFDAPEVVTPVSSIRGLCRVSLAGVL